MDKQVTFVLLAFSATGIFSSCQTAHNVAVTSFRVIDAPAAYIRRRVDASDARTAATTTTSTPADSDVVAPGRVVQPTSSPQSRTTAQRRPTTTSNDSNRSAHTEAAKSKPQTSPSDSPRVAASPQSPQLPYAKPVPGKPGYVFSPFDSSGGYVDVTGYTPGSKVKDPYSGKIFLVP